LEIIDDHGMVSVEIFRATRKSRAQLHFILRVKANEDRLIVAFDIFRRLVAKPAEQRVAGLAGASEEVKLGLSLGDAVQADQLKLIIFFERAIEEFEFPIRATGNVEDAIRSVPTVHYEHRAVVCQRGLGGGSGLRRG